MSKTITELSKELSISRQAIHQVLDKLVDKKKLRKKGNAFVLNVKEQDIIKEYFMRNTEEESSNKSSTILRELSTDLTITLQQQNEFLMRELEIKNKQIEELHVLLLREKETNILSESKKDSRVDFNLSKDEDESEQEKKESKKRRWYDIFRKSDDRSS